MATEHSVIKLKAAQVVTFLSWKYRKQQVMTFRKLQKATKCHDQLNYTKFDTKRYLTIGSSPSILHDL